MNPKDDPQIQQIEGDRFHEVAQLMGVENQPQTPSQVSPQSVQPVTPIAQPVQSLDNSIASQLLGDANTVLDGSQITALRAAAPVIDDGHHPVDHPSTWRQPAPAKHTLQSLADVQAPNFSPAPKQTPQGHPPVAEPFLEDYEAREDKLNNASVWKRRFRHTVNRLSHNDEGLYLVLFLLGLLVWSIANRLLPAFGMRVLEYGSFGVLLATAGFFFLEREFYLSLAFVLGILIAKRFL